MSFDSAVLESMERNIQTEDEVCRLCEQSVPAEKFEAHSIFCLIGNECAIRITAIDEKLFDVNSCEKLIQR